VRAPTPPWERLIREGNGSLKPQDCLHFHTRTWGCGAGAVNRTTNRMGERRRTMQDPNEMRVKDAGANKGYNFVETKGGAITVFLHPARLIALVGADNRSNPPRDGPIEQTGASGSRRT